MAGDGGAKQANKNEGPVSGYKTESHTLEEIEDGKFRISHEFNGKGSCPHDPRHNSTAIFTGKCNVNQYKCFEAALN